MRIRISLPGGERSDLVAGEGVVRVGSAPGSDIQLPTAKGVRPKHAEVHYDQRRGVELKVMEPGAVVVVNGRPVKEKAILRLGDVVVIGQVRLVLKPEVERQDKPPKLDPAAIETKLSFAPPRVVLRGVSGAYFGKVITLKGKTVIGRGSDCDLVLNEPEMSRRHAILENTPQGLYLRDLGSANGTSVNGQLVRDIVLRPGDQVAFDQNRFLVEAPGYLSMPIEAEPVTGVITQVQRPLVIPKAPEEPKKDNNTVDWIIMGAAGVILAALAVLVYLEFMRD